MTNRKLFCTSCAGTIIVALCCFTPILVVGLGMMGLSAWLGWLDYVLFPALAFFIVLTGFGYWRWKKSGFRIALEDGSAGKRPCP